MIDLYFFSTPNGYKPLILLCELGIDYRIIPINILKGEQFAPDFLKIAPNNRIPAIVDHAPTFGDQQGAFSLFESGVILEYLAKKEGRFLAQNERVKWHQLQWLYWQMGGLGPMAGQNHHFSVYAPEKIDYAIKRYVNETARLYAVLNKQLTGRDFICGDYSIADMACWPWIRSHERQSQNLDDFPALKAWFERIKQRPAVTEAYQRGEAACADKSEQTQQEFQALFMQSKDSVK